MAAAYVHIITTNLYTINFPSFINYVQILLLTPKLFSEQLTSLSISVYYTAALETGLLLFNKADHRLATSLCYLALSLI